MAYNLSERFQSAPRRYQILDPGAYQYPNPPLIKPNKVPFLSRAPRQLTAIGTLATHEMYYRNVPLKVPNCTAFKSNVPRFEYDMDNKEYLCDCESKESDTIVDHETVEQGICQAKAHRRIFKGLSSYTFKKKFTPTIDVPFYDARVQESTAFYRGCKWSKWSTKRDKKIAETGPGPADYNIEPGPTATEICDEKVRALKRRTSKQLRYLDLIQRRNILDNQPSPAAYYAILPGRKDFHYTTTRSRNFVKNLIKSDIRPGPADHFIRRDFDIGYEDHITCHFQLPPRAPFGVKAARFKRRREEGPGPASYSVRFFSCQMKQNLGNVCISAPFGTSAKRFKETLIESSDDEDFDVEPITEQHHNDADKCKSSWPFKSKTVRMKSPKVCESGHNPTQPAEQVQIGRSARLQHIAPFCSSEGRFRNWFNWIHIHGELHTPSPAYYCLERPKCIPAVCSGPLIRAARFKYPKYQNPAPNQFMLTGIESILKTHNLKLKTNIENRSKCQSHWQPVQRPVKLTPEEQEKKLLYESIALLDVDDIFEEKNQKSKRRLKGKTKKESIKIYENNKNKS